MLFSFSNCEEFLYRIISLINIDIDEEFFAFVLFRNMEWTDHHDVLFCREVIAFELFTHKPGPKERDIDNLIVGSNTEFETITYDATALINNVEEAKSSKMHLLTGNAFFFFFLFNCYLTAHGQLWAILKGKALLIRY